DRHARVGHVGPGEVNPFDAESREAAVERRVHGGAREALAMLRPRARAERFGAELRRDAHALTHAGPLGEPPTEELLARAAVARRARPERVAVGGVDPCAALLGEAVE